MGVMLLLAMLLTVLALTETQAHDSSAYGGLFRSRDTGASWFPADPGLFLSGVLDVAISPADTNTLLLATDTGLLCSHNGGRTWAREAPTVFGSGVYAVAFDADGRGALASTATGLYRTEDASHWWHIAAPAGAAAASAIVPGGDARRLYMASPGGVWRSDDRGRSWLDIGEGLPAGAVRRLLVVTTPEDTLYAIAGGRLWKRAKGIHRWQAHDTGLPVGRVETFALDRGEPERLWAAAADRIFVSTDRGVSWRPVGHPLPDAHTALHGLAVTEAGTIMVLTTHRGLWRSADGGRSWRLMEENLPVHLEAGPLVRDPTNAAALYAGFSLLPYSELWARGLQGKPPVHRVDALSLAGGTAFLLALALLGGLAVRWLAHARRATMPARPWSMEPRQ
jgi:photosystem II stability/assembly factor-like uncharacterized protein